ncbi:MAG: fatty-acyl-CoA synthase [Planctomycetota bacterium]
MNVWNFLADAATNWPERVALRRDQELSYADTARRALDVAAHLRASGVQPGDRVGCLMDNDVDHLLAYFGIAAAGAILVSLNTRLTAGEQRDILTHSGSKLLLHDQVHATRATEIGVAVTTVADAQPAKFAATPAAHDQPAHLYYTSGTTGSPKGVVLTHENICTHALAAVSELGLCERDTWAHIAPMFHLADAWATFAITAVGGCHVFLPQFTPMAALDLLCDERVTITNLVPTMLNLMVKEPDAKHRDYSLRVMLSGGAPIAPGVVKRILTTFSCDYVQTYGMTETSPYLTLSLLPPELLELPLEQQLQWKCKTGRAFKGVELRVVNDDGSAIPADGKAVGEIRVRGKTVTPGYWRNDEATNDAFDADGFLMTGDLANIDSHGFVDIVDRKKDVIKTGGESVYSIEVEYILYEHPAVLECAVFGRADERWGERVVAAVVVRTGQQVTSDELIAFCREHIAGYKTPKQVVFLAALPRTGSGKIQKRALREVTE